MLDSGIWGYSEAYNIGFGITGVIPKHIILVWGRKFAGPLGPSVSDNQLDVYGPCVPMFPVPMVPMEPMIPQKTKKNIPKNRKIPKKQRSL